MNLDFLIFNTDHQKPISLIDPISGVEQELDIDTCCEYLSKHRNGVNKHLLNSDITTGIKHWWDRKWYTALDYYLCSPPQKNNSSARNAESEYLYQGNISLSTEQVSDKLTPIQAILSRKTYREFKQSPIAWQTYSALLRVLDGALFSGIWQYYLVVLNVQVIAQGVYRYYEKTASLELIRKGAFREQLMESLCGFPSPLTASFTIVFAIDLQKAQARLPYSRALREIYIDVGRSAQKLLIKGIQQNIGGVPIAMRDSLMGKLLEVDINKIMPIQALTMGLIPES